MDEQIQRLDREPQIELRPFSAADAETYFNLINSNRQHFSKFGNTTSGNYPDIESVRLEVPGNKKRWGAYLDGAIVGAISLETLPETPEIAEIAYLVSENRGRQGIATAAVRKLMHNQHEYKAFIAHTHPENVPSQRVLEKAGFVREGLHKIGDMLLFRYSRKDSANP